MVHSKDAVAFYLQNKESQPKTYTRLKYSQEQSFRLQQEYTLFTMYFFLAPLHLSAFFLMFGISEQQTRIEYTFLKN